VLVGIGVTVAGHRNRSPFGRPISLRGSTRSLSEGQSPWRLLPVRMRAIGF